MESINAVKYFQDNKYEDVFKNNTKNTSITIVKLTQNLQNPEKINFEITL